MYDVAPNWDVLITQSLQNLDVQGLSAQYPIGSDFQTLKPLQITSFVPNFDHDRFESTAWTVHGQLGPLKAVYTGSYLERHIDNQVDYTNYSRTAYGQYYECTGGTTGFGKANAVCFSPATYWHDRVKNTHLTNEFRLSTPDTGRIRAIGGVFQETFRVEDIMNFEYKTIPSCNPQNLAIALAGGQACVANTRTIAGAEVNEPGTRDDNAGFGEDVKRGYTQVAVFGSVDFDIIPDVLTVTGGTRYYNYKEYEVGAQYSTGAACLNVPNGQCGPLGGTFDIGPHNDHVTYHGFKSRGSLNWHVDADDARVLHLLAGLPSGRVQPVAAVGGEGRQRQRAISDAEQLCARQPRQLRDRPQDLAVRPAAAAQPDGVQHELEERSVPVLQPDPARQHDVRRQRPRLQHQGRRSSADRADHPRPDLPGNGDVQRQQADQLAVPRQQHRRPRRRSASASPR